jgi:hypothetical protein
VFNHPENELSLLPTNHAQGKKNPKKKKKKQESRQKNAKPYSQPL